MKPITCRMQFDGHLMRFCAFTTERPVGVADGQSFEFVEKAYADRLLELVKAQYEALVHYDSSHYCNEGYPCTHDRTAHEVLIETERVLGEL